MELLNVTIYLKDVIFFSGTTTKSQKEAFAGGSSRSNRSSSLTGLNVKTDLNRN